MYGWRIEIYGWRKRDNGLRMEVYGWMAGRG
jgi:hypothetical protein